MSETPRRGDRVRVTYEGTVCDPTHLGTNLQLLTDGMWPIVPKSARVEILERADDPARDPIGTVREELDRSATYVRTAQGWMTVHDPRHTGIGGVFAYDDSVSRAPIIGVVPGTPAADAQTPPEVVRSGDPEPPRDARYTDTGGDTWSYGVHGDGSTGWGFGKAPWTWTWDDHPLRFPWTLKEGA